MRARDYTDEGLGNQLDVLADLMKQEGGWAAWIGLVREASRRLTPGRRQCSSVGIECRRKTCKIHGAQR